MGDKSEFEKFSTLTKRLLSVPKKEIDKRHKEWEQEKDQNTNLRKPADAAFPAILATVLSWLALRVAFDRLAANR